MATNEHNDQEVTIWVNIYPDETGSESFATELEADKHARPDRIGKPEPLKTDLKTATAVLKRLSC